MAGFNYEWWTVMVAFEEMTPICVEFKGKSKKHVIRQIEKMVAESNSKENAERDIWSRKQRVREVLWETLKLDRVGYQRLS